MSKNVLIGIGGTGSRVIESVVHLCAAGYGPDKLHVFIIDPDSGNGNLTRTKTLIQQYSELRAKFQRVKGNNCFKTEIVIPPDGGTFIWSIFDEKKYTLSKFINHDNLKKNDPNLADLANVLFTKKELETKLDEGFRGHPSIGAVVMSDPPMDEYPFKLLWDDTASLHANDLRVFLVGSIFGGTGAAGFPTLGSEQLIKFNEQKQAKLAAGKSKVLMGGALVLPYFSFSVDETSNEPMFVTPNDFPIATKAALQYYNDKQLGFDQYYFIGDSLAQKVGEFSAGSSTQENYPHYIEMVSSLAAFDFFKQDTIEGVPDKKYFISCRDDKNLDWNQLPLTRDSNLLQDERKKFRKLLIDFTVFSYSYLTYGKQILNTAHRDLRNESWYRDTFDRKFREDNPLFNPRHDDNKAIYEIADDYLAKFLFWISAMDDGDGGNVNLINKEMLFSGVLQLNTKNNKLKDPTAFKANIGQILWDKTNKKDFNFFIQEGLEVSVISDETIGAGSKYLNVFYNAASKFNTNNMELN